MFPGTLRRGRDTSGKCGLRTGLGREMMSGGGGVPAWGQPPAPNLPTSALQPGGAGKHFLHCYQTGSFEGQTPPTTKATR